MKDEHKRVGEHQLAHLVEEDYLDVWQCVDCGAYADTISQVVHHETCIPGESDRWERFYTDANRDEIEHFNNQW